jgi:hypothetical protein
MAKQLRDLIEGDLHHVSPRDDIEQFHPLTHFGTSKAAFQAGKYKNRADNAEGRPSTHYKVRINKGNVLKLRGDSGEHTPSSILYSLTHTGHISHDEYLHHHEKIKELDHKHGGDTWSKPSLQAKEYAANVIRSKGFHTLEYKNHFEHPGSKSYMITHPSQVTVRDKHVGVKAEVPDSPRYTERREKLYAKWRKQAGN